MTTYGRQTGPSTGRSVMVICGRTEDIDWKIAGITLDWSLFAAVTGAPATLPDDTIVQVGQRYARYGQIVCRVTQVEVQTVTLTSATGGDYTLAGSADIAFDATAAEVQTALEAIFGAGMVVVTGAAGGPYTVTFDNSLGNVATMAVVDSTTGAGHSVVAAPVTEGATGAGKWGPYDPNATDGRQTLTPGECWIINETVIDTGVISGLGPVTDHPAVLDGGPVWKARILMTAGSASLAAGPTIAAVRTAFPRLQYVES